MKRTNIYLAESQTEALDRLARQSGRSRADLIRELLGRALEGRDHDLEADLAAIEAAFGACGDLVRTDRGDGDREDHLTRMWTLSA